MGFLQRLGFRTGPSAVAIAEARGLTFADVFGEDYDRYFDVTGEKALRLIPVYAAVAMIATSMGSLPLQVFLKSLGSRKHQDTPDWLRFPDRRIFLFDWIHQALTSLLLRGNAYGLVLRVNGLVDQVIWIHPSNVFIDESGPLPVYYLAGSGDPHWATTMGGDILHIRGFTQPGSVVGLSPVGLFKTQLETAGLAVDYGHDWFENSAVPAGILKNDKATLNPTTTAEAKAQFMSSVKRGEPVALDQNWSWEKVSLSPEEAQFLATIKATATQIAAIFRVDPEELGGETGNSMTYSTVEGNQRKFDIRTMLPWVTRFEQALDSLLPREQTAKFNLDVNARPNLLERSKAITENLRNGTLTLAEARLLGDRAALTPLEIEQWQQWFATTKSESESDATSTSVSTTKEGD